MIRLYGFFNLLAAAFDLGIFIFKPFFLFNADAVTLCAVIADDGSEGLITLGVIAPEMFAPNGEVTPGISTTLIVCNVLLATACCMLFWAALEDDCTVETAC